MAEDRDPTENSHGTPRPFDVQTISYLVRLMSRHDLSEIDLQEGDRRIRLRRGSRILSSPGLLSTPVVPMAPMGISPMTEGLSGAKTSGPLSDGESSSAGTKVGPSKQLIEIKSQAVGTFYAQREPGTPPFVTVGSRVTTDTVVCIVEAMKVMNEITANCSGVIVEVVARDKDFVEYNTVLFRVDPTG